MVQVDNAAIFSAKLKVTLYAVNIVNVGIKKQDNYTT